MNIFRSYKRSRFFLWVNIIGLSIGLAGSIMLVLFVINEWSYDKHFENNNRIVRLLTVYDDEGEMFYSTRNLRNAYTELPDKVAGVEAAVQFLDFFKRTEVTVNQNRFQNVGCLLADPEVFKVFQMKFVEGNAETSLAAPNLVVLTRRYANIMFGSPEAAMNQSISCQGVECVVSGVVEEIPKNSHFSFDVLVSMKSYRGLNSLTCEFYTYYLIQKEASLQAVRVGIEREYQNLLKPFAEGVGVSEAQGLTEMLSDIYLNSKAGSGIGRSGSMLFIRMLSGLALFILLLAITNFINLFVSQGEMRMLEIGIRKTSGAWISDIIRQFFKEVSVIVSIAFVIGFFLAMLCVPHFSDLIRTHIDMQQLFNPAFILAVLAILGITIVLSALYPAFYLSRFSPIEILSKQIRFSKRRLTAGIVVFQSVISIILLSAILVLFKQTAYLQKLPIGYNPENVMSFVGNATINNNYQAVKQRLLTYPEVKAVSGSAHLFGRSGSHSGEAINVYGENDNIKQINGLRFLVGMSELMELELVEGRFWEESDSDSIRLLILNEAAVKLLGGESPFEKFFMYNGLARVIGVVKDFYYDDPAFPIEPIVISRASRPSYINIRFHENINPAKARQVVSDAIHQFDKGFVLEPIWNVDLYEQKFSIIKMYTRVLTIGTVFSIFVAMLGLLAIHLFTSFRRTKEIGIRKIFGAENTNIFLLLSFNMIKWIGIAAVIAIPIVAYLASGWLSVFANRVQLDWMVYVFPILIQCAIAILTTSGVTLKVLSQNPVKSLKTE